MQRSGGARAGAQAGLGAVRSPYKFSLTHSLGASSIEQNRTRQGVETTHPLLKNAQTAGASPGPVAVLRAGCGSRGASRAVLCTRAGRHPSCGAQRGESAGPGASPGGARRQGPQGRAHTRTGETWWRVGGGGGRGQLPERGAGLSGLGSGHCRGSGSAIEGSGGCAVCTRVLACGRALEDF